MVSQFTLYASCAKAKPNYQYSSESLPRLNTRRGWCFPVAWHHLSVIPMRVRAVRSRSAHGPG